MPDLEDVQDQIVSVVGRLARFRFRLAAVAFDLERFEPDRADVITDIESGLRASLENALVETLDPLLRALLDTAGNERAALLKAALDLAGVRNSLQSLADNLPRSPQEDAMLEGEIPPDLFTEIRSTVSAVNEDQLDLAINNLLQTAGYRQPLMGGQG